MQWRAERHAIVRLPSVRCRRQFLICSVPLVLLPPLLLAEVEAALFFRLLFGAASRPALGFRLLARISRSASRLRRFGSPAARFRAASTAGLNFSPE